MHYTKKTTINKEILCRFQKKFFQGSWKLKLTFFLDVFFALSGISLTWKTLAFGRFTSQERTKVTALKVEGANGVNS